MSKLVLGNPEAAQKADSSVLPDPWVDPRSSLIAFALKPKASVGSMSEPVELPMDGFSVCARAVVELGQQSENAMSFLDRKTAAKSVDKQTLRGAAWPRDEATGGAICQIVVRDTGFRRGEVLWRSVGLLIDGIGDHARGS